jgi:hypothetical protein
MKNWCFLDIIQSQILETDLIVLYQTCQSHDKLIDFIGFELI